MSLIWGVTRIIPFDAEYLAVDKEDLLVHEFMTAYTLLRASCSRGDLRLHLSVEGSREEVGAQIGEFKG